MEFKHINLITKYFEFETRVRNGWVRIGAKDFVNYLSVISEIDFIRKAKITHWF